MDGDKAREIAAWMRDEFARAGRLGQADAAEEIRRHFGAHCAPGGRIDKAILAAFSRLTEETVFWSARERAWRRREPGDPAVRRRGRIRRPLAGRAG